MDQLRPLMREFIEAIKSELDSEQLAHAAAHAAAPIKQKGYEVFLTLEATLKMGKSGKSSTEKEHIQL